MDAVKYLLFSLIWMAICSTSLAEHSPIPDHDKTIHVVADEWPGYTESGGKGFYFNLLRRIFEPKGYNIKYQILPFKRAIQYINLGKADIFLADDDMRYLKMLDFYNFDKISQPINPINYVIVTALYPKNSSYLWHDIETDLAMKLAWVKGYGYGDTLKLKHQQVYQINNTAQGLNLLLSGRIDCLLDDITDINVAMTRPEYKNIELRREVINKRNLYPIFYNNDHGQRLQALYDETMSAMINSGEIFSLYQQVGLNYRDVLKPTTYYANQLNAL